MKIAQLLFHIIENQVDNVPTYFRNVKMFLAEWFTIYKKRKIFEDVQLTEKQKQEVYNIWGRKIPLYWHRLYTKMSGHFDKNYIPEYFFTTKIEPKINPYSHSKPLSDKSLLDSLFGNLDYVRLPKTYLVNIHGRFYCNKKWISLDEAVNTLLNLSKDEVLIKPTIESSQGRNVGILKIKRLNERELKKIFVKYKKNYIIQEKVVSQEDLTRLHPSSLNTFRVLSFFIGDEVKICSYFLRIGMNGSTLDATMAGSFRIGINPNGVLFSSGFKVIGNELDICLEHPDTRIQFADYKILNFEKVINVAEKLHKLIPQVGAIGWDLAIDQQGNVVLIEMNTRTPNTAFGQICNCRGLFGNETKKMLNTLDLFNKG